MEKRQKTEAKTLIYKPRALTITTGNGINMPKAINN
jgi:hypothetical protein